MRVYDTRLGKFLSTDPITSKYPELTPYQFASNRPIDGIDFDGLENMSYLFKQNNKGTTKLSVFDWSKTEAKVGPLGAGVEVKTILKNGDIVHTFVYKDSKGITQTKTRVIPLRQQIDDLKVKNKQLENQIGNADKKIEDLETTYRSVSNMKAIGGDPRSGTDIARMAIQLDIHYKEDALKAEQEKAKSTIQQNEKTIKTLEKTQKLGKDSSENETEVKFGVDKTTEEHKQIDSKTGEQKK